MPAGGRLAEPGAADPVTGTVGPAAGTADPGAGTAHYVAGPVVQQAGTVAPDHGPAGRWLPRLRLPADHEAELAAEAESLAILGWPGLAAGDERAPGDELAPGEGLAAGAGSGSPDGDPAWLSCLPAALLWEYADAVAVPAPREVLKAGFWDRSGEAGLGFASGGNADTLPPGPVLAGLAGRAWTGGLDQRTDDELIGLLRAGRRLASWSAALELAAAGEVLGRRYAEAEATGETHDAEHAGDEIAAALTLTGRSADRLTDLAAALWQLPGTAAALRAGKIDLPRAEVIITECTGLRREHAAAVEAVVLPAAPGLTTGQLRPVVRRAVIAADPGAALERKERARRDARVERWAEHAGTAALAGRDLPPAEVLAADRHLTSLAAQLKHAGRPGTMDNLRASVYLCLLAGQPVSALLPPGAAGDAGTRGRGEPPTAQPSRGVPGRGEPVSPPATTARLSRGGPGRGEPFTPPAAPATTALLNRGAPGLSGSVNLTMPLATWLGLAEAPGEAAGHGALDAADARSLAAALAVRPGNRWCITLTDARGRPAAHGCARAGPEGSALSAGAASWSATVTIRPLAAGECGHARQTRAYQLSPTLRHLIEIRQATCCFPGCRRPAVRCDKDHTVPYDQGGKTCECNCAPLCRRHHGAKQAARWHLDQPEPGTMSWITPSGRRYLTGPTSYPQ